MKAPILPMVELQEGVSAFNLRLTEPQLTQFQTFYEALIDWNQQVNLTRIEKRDEVITKHFLDSLSCLQAMPQLPPLVIDVGTGAGFPGIPLKIVQPHIALTLVEATGKKVSFLRHMVQVLQLEQVTIVHERAETVGQSAAYRGQFDLALARAVAPLSVLLEYLLPLLKPGGMLMALKGQAVSAEIAQAASALTVLGGQLTKSVSLTLPGSDLARNLILVEKVGPTPKKYPRKPGTPNKRPLL